MFIVYGRKEILKRSNSNEEKKYYTSIVVVDGWSNIERIQSIERTLHQEFHEWRRAEWRQDDVGTVCNEKCKVRWMVGYPPTKCKTRRRRRARERARTSEEANVQKWQPHGHTAYGEQIANNCFHLINLWLWCTNKNVNCNFQLYERPSCARRLAGLHRTLNTFSKLKHYSNQK